MNSGLRLSGASRTSIKIMADRTDPCAAFRSVDKNNLDIQIINQRFLGQKAEFVAFHVIGRLDPIFSYIFPFYTVGR